MSAQTWQLALKNMIREPKILLERLNIDESYLPKALMAAKLFPLRVSESFVARMQKGDLNDPLLRQVLPLADELNEVPEFIPDPLKEKDKNPIPGLLHKFKGRVLLTASSVCAINCRFCFRRTFAYSENNPGRKEWQQAFDYIAKDNSIMEVILSGGDPLTLDDDYLNFFMQNLAAIPHVKLLRIHTRLPMMIPERITDELIATLTRTRLKPIFIIHCNHPQEINIEVGNTLKKLSEHMQVLNQSVLLKGINDNADTLRTLCETLFDYNVLPYYLHQLDKVSGTAHFAVDDKIAIDLHQQICAQLPGYLVPRLVREVPGLPNKEMMISL